MAKSYRVTLTPEEVERCQDRVRRGKWTALQRKRAQILLLANQPGNTDALIAAQVGSHRRTVEEIRRRFVEEGFEATLEGKPKGHRPRSIQGEDEARLIALACEETPEGQNHWSLRVLAERWARLENTDTKTVSHETVRRVLKKANSNPGNTRNSSSRRKARPRS